MRVADLFHTTELPAGVAGDAVEANEVSRDQLFFHQWHMGRLPSIDECCRYCLLLFRIQGIERRLCRGIRQTAAAALQVHQCRRGELGDNLLAVLLEVVARRTTE